MYAIARESANAYIIMVLEPIQQVSPIGGDCKARKVRLRTYNRLQ